MRNRTIDLESLGADVRAGTLSLREIGRKHGCSDAYVRKIMKRESWQRDLTDKVRERTRIKLLQEQGLPTVKLASENEIIERASDVQKEVVKIHRAEVCRLRLTATILVKQLQEAMENRADIIEMIGEETKGDKDGRKRWRMQNAVSIPVHAGVLRDLSMVMKNLTPLERQAYSLNDTPTTDPYADLSRDEIERRLAELEKRR